MKSVFWFSVLLSVVSCRRAPPEPESKNKASANTTTNSLSTASATKPAPMTPPQRPTPMMNENPGKDDPLHGKFSLDDALAGLAGTGTNLVAEIDTDLGKLSCDLYGDKAPNTVANFVGLARGLRDWKTPDGQWVKKPAYDGTTFHRVIKGFMIQGGDPSGTGAGQPGYVIDDEFWPGTTHDQRGLLCMANRGPNTNGAQFFILDAPAPHLTARRTYTNFGKCGPDAVIEKLASVPVRGDHSTSPTVIKKVTIRRK